MTTPITARCLCIHGNNEVAWQLLEITFLKLSADARLKIVVSACGRRNIHSEFTSAIVIKPHILCLSPCSVCSSLNPCVHVRPDDWNSLRSNLFSSVCGLKPSRGNNITPAVLTLKVVVVQLLSPVWLSCSFIDCSPLGSSVRGILQARIPEWVAIYFFRGSSPPRDQTSVFYIWESLPLSHLGSPDLDGNSTQDHTHLSWAHIWDFKCLQTYSLDKWKSRIHQKHELES